MPYRWLESATPLEVDARVTKLVSGRFGIDPAELRCSAKFSDDLGGDSISLLELAMEIEETFDLEIPDEALDQLQTTQDVSRYVAARLGLEA